MLYNTNETPLTRYHWQIARSAGFNPTKPINDLEEVYASLLINVDWGKNKTKKQEVCIPSFEATDADK